MKRASKHRVLIDRLVIIVLAACGVVVGYALGCGIALVQARSWLSNSCEAMQARDDAAIAEARNVLHDMQSSSLGFCSDSEIARFRTLVFRSDYLKDAGRMRAGKILCSATSGRPEQAVGPFKADFQLQDGTAVYQNLSPVKIARARRAALEFGSAYAVFGMEPSPQPIPIPAKLAITIQANGNQSANSVTAAADTGVPWYMTTDGDGLAGNTLYVTRCSKLNFSCAAATTTVSQVIHGQSDILYSSAFAGGMIGILCGLGCSFLFNRSHGTSHQLRRAVERGELDVVYQPIVNLATGEVVAAEALVRWTDEEGNAVNPEIFVKMAEELGFVKLITKLVLNRVMCDFAATLRNRSGFHISINVSAYDLLDPEFLPMVENSLKKANLRPESLAIEITERSATNDEVAMETIRKLKRFGHGIHVDDFGAGYSNLDRLLCLYSDTIKIDKAFTRLIGTESVAAVILPQIMNLARSLNLGVVVEGVETVRQADYFSSDAQRIYAQGWLFGRPMTAEAFLAQLANGHLPAKAIQEGRPVLSVKPAGFA